MDGVTLTDDPQEISEQGQRNPLPFIAGFNSFEGNLSLVLPWTDQRPRVEVEKRIDRLAPLYGKRPDDKAAWNDLYGDVFFGASTLLLVREMERTRTPAWTYYFDYVRGRGLKGVTANCVLASKVTVLKPEMVRPSVEKSLQVLGVDRVDVMQIHSSGAVENLGFDGSMSIHAELIKLRDERLFRFIGLTTHVAFETVYRLIATGGFDQTLLTICYFHKGMDTLLSERNREFREKCLDKARDLGIAVVAMKVMGVSIYGRMSKSVVTDYDPAARAKDGFVSLPELTEALKARKN